MTLEELLRQGKSFGQGASNAAASTVTGPVDMLAWLLRKGGVNVGDAPMGGEAWMRQKGLMATPENKLAGLLGEGAGLAAPIVAAAKAPEIAGGLLQMGRNLATPQTMNKQTGAIVYHGSPHKFDKFDSSKIGTGEGAQAFGRGLYAAENPAVAKEYQFIGAQIDPDSVTYGGKKLENLYNSAQMAQERAHRMPNTPLKQQMIDKANAELGLWESMMTRNHPKQVIEQALDPEAGWAAQAQFAKQLDINKFGGVDMNPGNFYKVDLPDEHIAKMLNYDATLSKQTKPVQAAIKAKLAELGYSPNKNGLRAYHIEHGGFADPTGESLIKNFFGKTPQESADFLSGKGIPGVKYLDQFSRDAGKGTSNFVVFPGNEGLLKILERNGGKP